MHLGMELVKTSPKPAAESKSLIAGAQLQDLGGNGGGITFGSSTNFANSNNSICGQIQKLGLGCNYLIARFCRTLCCACANVASGLFCHASATSVAEDVA